MTTVTEDKIKVLEKAIEVLRIEDNNMGICDAVNWAVGSLDFDYDIFGSLKFYGITLPPRNYAFLDCYAFSFPLTDDGKKQRIEFIEQAINKLKSHE